MKPETIAASPNGYSILLDRETDSLVVEPAEGASRIVIDLQNGKIEISSPGDVAITAGGKLRLRGNEGVEIDGGGDIRMISSEETIIRGKMVRLN